MGGRYNGASEALSVLLCRAAEHDLRLSAVPAFPAMPVMASLGLGVQSYALRDEAGFVQSADQILAASTPTRLVWSIRLRIGGLRHGEVELRAGRIV